MERPPKDTGGPVVKTGPTAGKNRSRTKEGTWRRKRSDAGKPRKSKLCFVTTAACVYKKKPDDCRELTLLRYLRDFHLMNNREGRALVAAYYEIAPKIAESLTEQADLEYVWKVVTCCANAVELGRFSEAVNQYARMIKVLEAKHL